MICLMTQIQHTHTLMPPVSFWVLGDLHYRAIVPWHNFHTLRLASLYDDVQALWQTDGKPAFCVSPGDIIETCAPENYQLAKTAVLAQLGDIPFYPGIGNHEYYGPDGEDPLHMAEAFTAIWGKPLRYAWEAQGIVFIMLDYPNPATFGASRAHLPFSRDARIP